MKILNYFPYTGNPRLRYRIKFFLLTLAGLAVCTQLPRAGRCWRLMRVVRQCEQLSSRNCGRVAYEGYPARVDNLVNRPEYRRSTDGAVLSEHTIDDLASSIGIRESLAMVAYSVMCSQLRLEENF